MIAHYKRFCCFVAANLIKKILLLEVRNKLGFVKTFKKIYTTRMDHLYREAQRIGYPCRRKQDIWYKRLGPTAINRPT